MALVHAHIPAGSLAAGAEQALLAELPGILASWTAPYPEAAAARATPWTMVHRPQSVLVDGEVSHQPRYQFTISLPAGVADDAARAGICADLARAVLAAEGTHPSAFNRSRVWVQVDEVACGSWGLP